MEADASTLSGRDWLALCYPLLWNFPTLQADELTCSQRKFLSAAGTFDWDSLWWNQFHVVVKIVPETIVKELLLVERARAACDRQSTPACSSTIHIE